MEKELDEMQADRNRWMHMALALKKLGFGANLKTITKDRDLWKARVVALERAMKELAGCESCVHEQTNYYAEPCKSCKDSRSDWQFDLDRFTKED